MTTPRRARHDHHSNIIPSSNDKAFERTSIYMSCRSTCLIGVLLKKVTGQWRFLHGVRTIYDTTAVHVKLCPKNRHCPF